MPATTMKTHYQVLGVSHDASLDEIKRAYRQLALLNHPDKTQALSNNERKEREEFMKEVAIAYHALADYSHRQLYDNKIVPTTQKSSCSIPARPAAQHDDYGRSESSETVSCECGAWKLIHGLSQGRFIPAEKHKTKIGKWCFKVHVPVYFRVIFSQTDTATFGDPYCARITLCLTLAPQLRTGVHEHVSSATFRMELKKAPGEPQRIEFKYTELMEDNRLVVTILAAEGKKAFKRRLVVDCNINGPRGVNRAEQSEPFIETRRFEYLPSGERPIISHFFGTS